MFNIERLTIITITFNNQDEFKLTYDSLIDFRRKGGCHIIINGGESISNIVQKDCILIEEPDSGIYDAINKGVEKVKTKFFMLIHSGDTLTAKPKTLTKLLSLMESENLDFMLNNCSIQFGSIKRKMKSNHWQKWMLDYGVQPPHPPIIYRSSTIGGYSYDLNSPVVADFLYLNKLFNSDLKYAKGNLSLVHMIGGGKTSSGFKSISLVGKELRLVMNKKNFLVINFIRPLLKLYLWI